MRTELFLLMSHESPPPTFSTDPWSPVVRSDFPWLYPIGLAMSYCPWLLILVLKSCVDRLSYRFDSFDWSVTLLPMPIYMPKYPSSMLWTMPDEPILVPMSVLVVPTVKLPTRNTSAVHFRHHKRSTLCFCGLKATKAIRHYPCYMYPEVKKDPKNILCPLCLIEGAQMLHQFGLPRPQTTIYQGP